MSASSCQRDDCVLLMPKSSSFMVASCDDDRRSPPGLSRSPLFQELADLGAQANAAALSFRFDVVGSPLVLLERGGAVANVLRLIDHRLGLSDPLGRPRWRSGLSSAWRTPVSPSRP